MNKLLYCKIEPHKSCWIFWLTLAVVFFYVLGSTDCHAVSLTITANNGSVSVTPEKVDYNVGEVVQLIPRPDTGFYFTGWSGDVYGKKLVLNLTMDSDKSVIANFDTWQAPVGVPEPEFGIFETYRMYDNPANRNPALTYTQNSEGGYYTHYIDNTHPDATDTNNSYGTESIPRITIPTNFIEGSVVEIHGGPYTYGTYIWRLSGQGTAGKPIFVRGWDPNDQNNFPVIQGKDIRHSGNYMILENLDLLDTMIIFYPGDSIYDHMTIRNNLIHGQLSPTGSAIALGDFRHVNPTFDHTVIYNNHIYNNGMPRDQYDFHGIAIMDYATNVWIMDNHIHDNDGDSIQLNAAAGQAAVSGEHPQYVYIGRNLMHHDTENAVDLKDSEHVIISENTMYGYQALFDSDGTACLPGNEGGRLTWVLCNDIYDSVNAIRIDDEVLSNTTYIIGNTLHDTYANGIITFRKMTIHVINNVLYNIPGSGFVSWFARHTTVGDTKDSDYSFVNNIFSEVGGFEIEIDDGAGMSELTDRIPISNNIFHKNSGQISIKWADSTYNSVADFINGEPGKGSGCIEANPQFIDAGNNDYSLQFSSPAIDTGIISDVYQTFFNLYGIDIRKDIEGRTRPQGSAWDIGAHEYFLSDVNNLSISGTSQNSVTAVWTVPGEEGVTSKPGHYDIRYSTNLITEANWGTSTQVQGEPIADDFGQQQSFTISALNPGTTYYVAIKTSNDTGSTTSPLSNVASGMTTNSGNHAPVLEPIGDQSVEEEQTLTFVVNATDANAEDTLTYSAIDIPAGADFNGTTRTFNWTPTIVQEGIYHVTFQVDDGQVVVSETIMITVTPVQSALTISSTGSGSTIPAEGIHSYNEGTLVQIRATANNNWHFLDWTGDLSGSTNPTTILMDTDKSVIANFEIDQHTLTISSTSGGSVTEPGEGQIQYDYGTVVPIQATSAQNFLFVNWTGTAVNAGKVANPNTSSTTVTVDTDYAVQAHFDAPDGIPPTVTGRSPDVNDIQVPLNSLMILHITDVGIGVDASSVTITLDGNTIYTGSTTEYTSATGVCRRSGTPADFTYVYQPSQLFDFDQHITIGVSAADIGGEVITESYSFTTVMRSFGKNIKVNSLTGTLIQNNPAVSTDNTGNIWAVWDQTTDTGHTDIYVGKLGVNESVFEVSSPVVTDTDNQRNPAIAIDGSDKLYVAWEGDDPNGNWDIFVSTSTDGEVWSNPVQVNTGDPNNDSDQTSPAIAIDGDDKAYITWEDERAGNKDIWIATSTDGTAWSNERVTTDISHQTDPAIAIDSSNVAYVVWTDRNRTPNGGADIYGADSTTGTWTNIAVIEGSGNQWAPAVATESSGTALHLLWIDDTDPSGSIFYATSANGLQGPFLEDPNVVDVDERTFGQTEPAIAILGTGSSVEVFTCWRDGRWIDDGDDADIYFAETVSSFGTNVLVNDDVGANTQTAPDIGIDKDGNPYVVWVDDRNGNNDIYYAGATFQGPPLATGYISAVTGGTVVDSNSDVSVEILPNSIACDVTVKIRSVFNLPEGPSGSFCVPYDFSPSGLEFDPPAIITIRHTASECPCCSVWCVYWYDTQTGTWKQDGIDNVEHLTSSDDPTLPSDIHAIRFQAEHFTIFAQGSRSGGGSGGSGGGCSLSHSRDVSIMGYFLPYGVLVLYVLIHKLRNRRYKIE